MSVPQLTIKVVGPAADFRKGISQVMTGESVTKDIILSATTRCDECPEPASVCANHVTQAAQVEDGDVEEG